MKKNQILFDELAKKHMIPTMSIEMKEKTNCAGATLEVLSLMIQQLEIVAGGIGVEPAVKLEAARWHTKFSGKRQKLLLRAGK